jgi:hypothetical protein
MDRNGCSLVHIASILFLPQPSLSLFLYSLFFITRSHFIFLIFPTVLPTTFHLGYDPTVGDAMFAETGLSEMLIPIYHLTEHFKSQAPYISSCQIARICFVFPFSVNLFALLLVLFIP